MFIANMFKELSGGSFIFESNSVESTYYWHYLLFDLKWNQQQRIGDIIRAQVPFRMLYFCLLAVSRDI